MKKNWIIFGIVITLICPFIVYLIYNLQSVSELIYPPTSEDVNYKIEEAFKNSVDKPENIELVYPTSGDYRSAYIKFDIDSDDVDEVIVFYTLTTDESTIYFALLDYIDGEWKCIDNVSGYGSDVYSVSFSDLNNDGVSEIVVSWTLLNAQIGKTMSVHECNVEDNNINSVNTLINQQYSYMAILDMNSDNEPEIFYTVLSTGNTDSQKSTASLLKMNEDGTITAYGTGVALDGSVSSYTNLYTQKLSDGKYRILLDAAKGTDSMITEVIEWNEAENCLTAPLVNKETLTNSLTLRTPALGCRDIDGNKEIDIPIISGSDSSNPGIYNVNWCDYSGGKLVSSCYSVLNMNIGYTVLTSSPDIYGTTDLSKKTVYFLKQDGTALFSIYTASITDWSKNPVDGYSILTKDKNSIYAFCIYESGAKDGITQETLTKSFVIL